MSKKNRHIGLNLHSFPTYPFDYSYLMWVLRFYHSPRDKVSQMIKKGDIIRIKKGLYILSSDYGGQIDKKVIANLIYGPSYVSLEFAMQYWGLIPERVEVVTSVTNKRKKFFNTPLGTYSYTYLNKNSFYPGILLKNSKILKPRESRGAEIGFFIASKEKAICDKLATVNEISTEIEAEAYLETDLRIDVEALRDLDMGLLGQIEKAYNKRSITAFVRWYKIFRRILK